MSSTEAPPANSAMTLLTGKRIPRMQGFPAITRGFAVIRGKPSKERVIEPSTPILVEVTREADHLGCLLVRQGQAAGTMAERREPRNTSIHPCLRLDVLHLVG